MTVFGTDMNGEVGERLRTTAVTLEAGANAYADYVRTHGWKPSAGSAALMDLDAPLSSPDGTAWPDEMRGRVGRVVIDYAGMAAGHLSTLSVLYATGEVLYSAQLLARAVLEHAQRVCWILEPTREKDANRPLRPEHRFARVYLEELTSAQRKLTTITALRGPADDDARNAARELDDLRDQEVPPLFGAETIDLADPRSNRIADERAMNFTKLEEWYVRNRIPDRQRGGYSALSDNLHPTLYAIREGTDVSGNPGNRVERRHIDPDYLDRVATVAISSFYQCMNHVVSYWGWDRAQLESWADLINEWMPGLIVGN